MHLCWKSLVLSLYHLSTAFSDTFTVIDTNNIKHCILPSVFDGNLSVNTPLKIFPLNDLNGIGCCDIISFTAVGGGIYKDFNSGFCIDRADNIQDIFNGKTGLFLGEGCYSGFTSTSTNQIRILRYDFCISYNSSNFVVLVPCDQVDVKVSLEKCFTPTTSTATTTITTTTTTSSTTTTTTTTTTTPSSTTTTTKPSTSTSTTGETTTRYKFGEWGEWGSCNETCGNGYQFLRRNCSTTSICNESELFKSKECKLRDCYGFVKTSPGESCQQKCNRLGYHCATFVNTKDSVTIYDTMHVELSCNTTEELWTESWHPSYDVTSQVCQGFKSLPDGKMNCEVENDIGYEKIKNMTIRLCVCEGDDDIGFSQWTSWTQCPVTCLGSIVRRTRTCLDQSMCTGKSVEEKICNDNPCEVNGGFTEWTSWSECSQSCGGGVSYSNRTCTNPKPAYGGNDCVGTRSKIRYCNVQYCPVHGGFTDWSPYYACSKPCGTGRRLRFRFCLNPRPVYGGRPCNGSFVEGPECNIRPCIPATVNLGVTFTDISFIEPYSSPQSNEFIDLFKKMKQGVDLILIDGFADGVNQSVNVEGLSIKGIDEIFASFKVRFQLLESYQLIMVQDFMDLLEYFYKVGKVSTTYDASSQDVPSSAPENVNVTVIDSTTIHLRWDPIKSNDINGELLGYLVFYIRKKHLSDDYSGKKASTTNSLTLIGLEPDTEYVLRVLAYNQIGNGISSQPVYGKTLGVPPFSPPTNLITVGTSNSTAYVGWDPVSINDMGGEPVGYVVFYESLNGHKGNVSVPFTENKKIVNDLKANLQYIFTICAENNYGVGLCAKQVATTLGIPPPPPLKFKFGCPENSSNLFLLWDSDYGKDESQEFSGYRISYQRIKIGTHLVEEDLLTVEIAPSYTSYELQVEFASTYRVTILRFKDQLEGESEELIGETCTCPEIVTGSYTVLPPYVKRIGNQLAGIFPSILPDLINGTCGLCCTKRKNYTSRIDFTNGEYSSIEELKKNLGKSMVAFPLLNGKENPVYFSGAFINMVDHPGVVFLIRKVSINEQIKKIVINMMKIWPLVLVMCLIVMVVAVIVWCLEFRENDGIDERFFSGVVDAAWLVIITMGTVGYGDITAVTFQGRVIVLLWVFISLVMTAVLVASISTNLLSAEETLSDFKIYGTKVATLKDSYEYKLAVQRNAIVENYYNSFEEISTALLMGQVDGVLVDSYSARDENRHFNISSFYTKDLIQYNDAFGLVINHDMLNSLSALNDYRETNHLLIARSIKENAQKMEIRLMERKSIPLFDEQSQAMIISLSSITALVAGTSFVGLLFTKLLPMIFLRRNPEIKYRKVRQSHRELMGLIKDFRGVLEKDSEMLEKRQLYDRVRYMKTGRPEFRHFNKDMTRVLMLTNEFYRTYDDRYISLDDTNALYI